MIKNNKEYWDISKNNPEPLIDEYYLIDKNLTTSQQISIKNLREILKDICEKNEFDNEDKLKKLINYLNEDGVQYTEFVAFMNAFDVSLSTFKKWSLTEKIEALKTIVRSYYKRRYNLYYKTISSEDVLIPQVMIDRGASRWKSESGKEKIKKIMKEEYNASETSTIDEFLHTKVAFLDINHYEEQFHKLKKQLALKKRFDKNPDLLIKVNEHILIVEAKHIKESGGAQDKSLLELCNFIAYEEENLSKEFVIHYLAFLDGVYASHFFNLEHQYSERALENLSNCPNNYFVNTEGFKQLIKDILLNMPTSNIEKLK
ncbi:MAG: hypothetical protein QXT38_03550 [Candidatus Aenigmatarchaeota archaeon]